ATCNPRDGAARLSLAIHRVGLPAPALHEIARWHGHAAANAEDPLGRRADHRLLTPGQPPGGRRGYHVPRMTDHVQALGAELGRFIAGSADTEQLKTAFRDYVS